MHYKTEDYTYRNQASNHAILIDTMAQLAYEIAKQRIAECKLYGDQLNVQMLWDLEEIPDLANKITELWIDYTSVHELPPFAHIDLVSCYGTNITTLPFTIWRVELRCEYWRYKEIVKTTLLLSEKSHLSDGVRKHIWISLGERI